MRFRPYPALALCLAGGWLLFAGSLRLAAQEAGVDLDAEAIEAPADSFLFSEDSSENGPGLNEDDFASDGGFWNDGRAGGMLAQNQPTPVGNTRRTLNGFAESPWRASFTEVKTRLKNLATSANAVERVEILMEERNDYILIKRNDIEYRYNFYKTPLIVERIANHELSEEQHDQTEAEFFHVKVIIPFIEASRINERLENIYGPPTRNSVDEDSGMGVNVWELEGGLIFQWYEPYNKTPYTRTIDYLSREMAERILREYDDYFDAREKILLQKILLQ